MESLEAKKRRFGRTRPAEKKAKLENLVKISPKGKKGEGGTKNGRRAIS